MVEEEEEVKLVEVSLEKLRQWYKEASTHLVEDVGIGLPDFPEKLPDADLILNEELGLHHAIGTAFYPCAGNDSKTIVELFGKHCSQIILATTKFGSLSIGRIGNVAVTNTSMPKNTGDYIKYRQDGLITLLKNIDQLGVFFYRGDSPGEGGSNQLWLKEVLFPVVLSKLQNKGLIVTDGSNCGYLDDECLDEYVPWNALCGMKPYQPPEVGNSFKWESFEFNCVSGPFYGGHGNDPTYVWQVENS